MKKNKISITKYVVLIFICVALLFLLLNDKGIVKYIELKREISGINLRIEQAQNKLNELNKQIKSLNNDSTEIEIIARKKYHMKLPKEKILKVSEK